MPRLSLYTFFHLNLMYSSIEEEQRLEVIRRCYWPLLRLARDFGIPIGIEASGHTLELIATLDPAWVEEFRDLLVSGKCEFIGSGYSQIIGPLVPSHVNEINQTLGLDVYEKYLGRRPILALVNEQAYSAGLIPHYLNAGYQAVIMEWDNPSSQHREWDYNWRFYPQFACENGGAKIPVVWNMSIPFQKFQRYVHGELSLHDYLDYLKLQVGEVDRVFCLYGNDVEVFDFRPGRFATEAALDLGQEWERIFELFQNLAEQECFRLMPPSGALDYLTCSHAGNELHLESAVSPIPVKKQTKYNILRWAVSGRDDLAINTRCWRIFEILRDIDPLGLKKALWRSLCICWSSDFRTHITHKRWSGLLETLDCLEKGLSGHGDSDQCPSLLRKFPLSTERSGFSLRREGHLIEIDNGRLRFRLNSYRGLSLDSCHFSQGPSDKMVVGTLPHGYFDNIQYGADYYTGHLVFEAPGQHKVTDLASVLPTVDQNENELLVRGEITTPLGKLRKTWRFFPNENYFELTYRFFWPDCPVGSLRFGYFTMSPELFDSQSLFFASHNGGSTAEKFSVNPHGVSHFSPVSALVSAHHALGMTDGMICLGDRNHTVTVFHKASQASLVAGILFVPVADSYLFRLCFSGAETDDTSVRILSREFWSDREISFRIQLDTLLS